MEPQGAPGDESIRRFLASYQPPPGVSDELLDAAGQVRPVWRSFIRQFAHLAREDLARRFARGDQYLRDAGVFFRQYGESGSVERAWPLSHVPVMIEGVEWTAIADGLIQRANLLEALAGDLYGDNRLVAEGRLPAELVARSREWLRPLVGVPPRGGHRLHFLAFEIGRGPNGSWWVLGDRAQAPSGSGFALENRVATSRVFSDFFAESRVERLAGFFGAFRDALQDLSGDAGARVAILTPGPLNDTYFEHAYIARHLGFSLLEGADLAVENGGVMVRTVAGLRPVNVLWRRMDSSFADPLELNPDSRIGTPGLMGAVRTGSVSMVNALGSGVLETRALLAFMPRIARQLLGEPLKLANIATWWCGGARERRYVRANTDRMMIGSAYSTRLPFDLDENTVLGGQFRGLARTNIDAWLEAEGARLVGQEAVTLSTTPAFVNGRLVPRPMSLRVFLARTRDGWRAMPGGFARIGQSADPTAIAMQRGGSAADVWVVSDAPVKPDAMLASGGGERFARVPPNSLPSRAADNLFWLGRYIERAEGAIRLLRAMHVRLAESGDPKSPLIRLVARRLKAMGVDAHEGVPKGLRSNLTSAIASASQVRDRFSTDGWAALNDLARTATRMAETVAPGDDAARAMSVLLRKITGFSGLVHENMHRFTGWRFLSIGRSLERALATCRNLIALAAADRPDGALDLLVEVGDSVMTHRRRYAVETSRETVADLLALDGMNPRAILHHLGEIREHVALLPDAEANGQLSRLSRAVLRAHAGLATLTPDEVSEAALLALASEIEALSDLLSNAYLR